MGQDLSKKRPWLAAVLGVAVTGLGHLYLRRWLRAVGWLVVAFLVSSFLVPESTLATLTSSGQIAWSEAVSLIVDTLPVIAVTMLSALDAYQIAVVNNYIIDTHISSDEAGDDPTLCPSCNRPVDDDLEFCQWCASPLSESGDHNTSDDSQQHD